jgi:hypothetical protein
MINSAYEGLENAPEKNLKDQYWQIARTLISVATYVAPLFFLDERRKKFDGNSEKDVIATFLFCASMLTNAYEVISSSLESCKSRNSNIKSDENSPAESSSDVESDRQTLLQNSSSCFEPIQLLEYCRNGLGYCVLPVATIGQSAAVAAQILNPSQEIIEMTNLAIQVFSVVGLPSSSLFTAIDLKIQEHIKNKKNPDDEAQQQENQKGLINCNSVSIFLNTAAAIASVALIMTMNKENELANTSIITAFTTLAKLSACYSKNQMLPQEAQIAESAYTFAMAITASIASSIPFFSNSDIKPIAIMSAVDMAISGLRPSVDNYTAEKVAEEKRGDIGEKPSPSCFFKNLKKMKDHLDLNHFLFEKIETDEKKPTTNPLQR